MKRIGVLTSGGDCPGLNAGIRAVVRAGLHHGLQVLGVRRGYSGLMRGEVIKLDHSSVSGIINRGGTFLLTARSEKFQTPAGLRKAVQTLSRHKLDGLVILGGNGSLAGASALASKTKTAIIGVPKSIDNDVGGTDYCIGFDTATNTAMEVIDKLRDTATSHERLFLVEVMGRNRGFLALASAVAGGAEEVLLPETPDHVRTLCKKLDQGKRLGKTSSIVVIAEGNESRAFEIAEKIEKISGYETRVSIIGHQQRGGAPSSFDRILASQLGNEAVEALIRGERNKMVGFQGGKVVLVPLETAWKLKKPLDALLLRLSQTLPR